MTSCVVRAVCPTAQIAAVEANLRELPDVAAVGSLRDKKKSSAQRDTTTLFITFVSADAASASSDKLRGIAGLRLTDDVHGGAEGAAQGRSVMEKSNGRKKGRQAKDLAVQFLQPPNLGQRGAVGTWRGKRAAEPVPVRKSSIEEELHKMVAQRAREQGTAPSESASATDHAHENTSAPRLIDSRRENNNRNNRSNRGGRQSNAMRDSQRQRADNESGHQGEVTQEGVRRPYARRGRGQGMRSAAMPPPPPPPAPFEANVAFVDNLPFSTPNDKIMEMFSPFGRIIDVNRLEMMAMICYDNPQSVQDCIQHLNGKCVGQNYITVSSGTVRIPSRIVAHIGLNSQITH